MFLLLSLLPIATADIAPTPPPGEQFATYHVRVEGLEAFPDVVLVLHDRSEQINAHRAFTAEKPEQQIANGFSSRGARFSSPDLFVMSADAYTAWSTLTSTEIERQRQACDERGEGCAHISRFVPRYAPPSDTTVCNAGIQIKTSSSVGGPERYVDTFTVTDAAPGRCSLSIQASAPAPEEASSSERGCAAVTATGGVVWGLALLLAGGRRRR
jgi:hypothetical protein